MTTIDLDGCWGEYYSKGDHVEIWVYYEGEEEVLGICEICEYTVAHAPFWLTGEYLGHMKVGLRTMDTVRYPKPHKCPGCGVEQTVFYHLCDKHNDGGKGTEVTETTDIPIAFGIPAPAIFVKEEEVPRFLTRVRNSIREMIPNL